MASTKKDTGDGSKLTTGSTAPLDENSIRKTLSAGGIKGADQDTVVKALPPGANTSTVRTAMAAFRDAKKLSDAGYSAELVRAVAQRTIATPGMKATDALQDVSNANPGLRIEAADAAKAAGVTLTAGGAQNPKDDTFGGNGGNVSQLADDSFLSQLRTQAKNFLSASDLQYLASVGSPDEFLTAMVKSEGAQGASRTLYEQTHLDEAAAAGITPDGEQFASTAKVAMNPSDRTTMTPASGQRITSRVDPGSAAGAALGQSTGKSVTEAVRYIRDMSPQDLTNLQRKLVDAGYYAQVMNGSSFEPDTWGDPTDPATSAAWKALLRDTIAQKTDVSTLLATRAGLYGDQLAKMRSDKAKQDARNALQDALLNQVTVTDAASLRVAASKIANSGDMLGKDLSPEDLDALAKLIQGTQARTQFAAKHGASVAVDVDPVAQMTEKIAQEHPVDVMGQRVASQADELARLLKGPGV